jgi:acetyl esterase
MPLDPQFREILDTFEAKGLLPLVRGDAVTTRAHYQRLALSRRGPQYVPEQVASVADQRSPGGVPVRVYEPLSPPGSTLIYLHGGGWVVGDVETHDPLCRHVANATRARVVSVDYRLAPEHPFPAGLDDAEEVMHWLWAEDPGRPLGVAGDSAGASLTAARYRADRLGELYLCRHCAMRLWPALAAQGWSLWLIGEPVLAAPAR